MPFALDKIQWSIKSCWADNFGAPALAGRFKRVVIRPFVRSSTIYSGCLVSAAPPTVFGQSF